MPKEVSSSTRTGAHRLRFVFSQVPGAVWATDRDLRITYAIGRLQDGTTDLRQVIGRTIYEFLRNDNPLEPAIAHHLAALSGECRSFRYELRGRWYEVHIEPLLEAKAAIVGCVGVAIDISERHATEERLVESQTRLAEAQRIAHMGSWEWDIERNVVHWSDELYRVYGVEAEQFGGTYEAFLERVHPDDRASTQNVVLQAFHTLKPFVYDHRIVRPDGEIRMLHTRGAVVAGVGGRARKLIGSCWDITETWQAERRQESSVSLLRATLESTADGILVVDRRGKVAAHNQRLIDLWSLPDGMIEGQEFDLLLAQVHDQLENGEECLRRVRELESRPEAESFDTLRFRDGRVFERYSRPQRIGHEVVGRVWSYRDVSEREGLLRRTLFLSDASRLLASLEVESALEGVARLSLTAMADACAIDLFEEEGGPRRLISISRDPASPMAIEMPTTFLAGQSLLRTDGAVSYIVMPVVAHGVVLGGLTFLLREPRRYSEVDLSLVQELAGRAALAIENGRLYQRTGDALRARDEFLSIAAHEIRGPVTSLHLSVQSLRMAELTEPAQVKMLEIIERQERHLSRFVDELLDMARARVGGLHLDLRPVDLAEVTRETVARLAPDVARSRAPLSVATMGRVVGMWDRTRLEQVVTNLLTNAIKFGLGKPIDVEVTAVGESARLVVRDYGIGIPMERQKQIFEPFERAVSTRHYGGLGLGLYIVRWIVEGLGGTVSVQSQPANGATFTVELPMGGASP